MPEIIFDENTIARVVGINSTTTSTSYVYVDESSNLDIGSLYGIPVVMGGEGRTQNMNAAIFGCGGVGSNLAYMLSRHAATERIYLIDHDTIEIGNLARQFFIKEDVGRNKAEALAATLQQFAPDKEFIALPQKIEDEGDLGQFENDNTNRRIFAFVCTDNIESKALISRYFRYAICLGCDENLVEMRRNFDNRSVWSVGEGYNSNQTFESNMFAAAIGYILFTRGHFDTLHRKIFINKFLDEINADRFNQTRREQSGQRREE